MEMEKREKEKKQKKASIKSLKRIIKQKLMTTIPVQFMEDINGINVY